jgi:hypothetical protein
MSSFFMRHFFCEIVCFGNISTGLILMQQIAYAILLSNFSPHWNLQSLFQFSLSVSLWVLGNACLGCRVFVLLPAIAVTVNYPVTLGYRVYPPLALCAGYYYQQSGEVHGMNVCLSVCWSVGLVGSKSFELLGFA